MSSSDAHAAAAEHPHNPHLAHHFDTIEKQDHAVRLGMWLFLGTEVLLFAGLFLGYTRLPPLLPPHLARGLAHAGPRAWAR